MTLSLGVLFLIILAGITLTTFHVTLSRDRKRRWIGIVILFLGPVLAPWVASAAAWSMGRFRGTRNVISSEEVFGLHTFFATYEIAMILMMVSFSFAGLRLVQKKRRVSSAECSLPGAGAIGERGA